MSNEGQLRLDWAREHMPVCSMISERFRKEKPFSGIRISMALHVEAKTGILALLMREGGGEISLASCNPLSSDDSVVEALRDNYHLDVHAKKGIDEETYYRYLNSVLDIKPQLVVDDGGDLVKLLHTTREESSGEVIGGNEETTTGVVRLRAMERDGVLKFPMFNVNDANMKHLFDNRYGTGQSTLDGFMHSTNLLIAGKNVVVAGYGYCGRGIASRMRGMGGIVTVTEIDPVKAVEARMDGFNVSTMNRAIREADIVVTATGMKNVISYDDMLVAKEGAVLCNSGHFNNEIAVGELQRKAMSVKQVRNEVKRYRLDNGNSVDVISDGRLVNLASGQGHPVEIMDMSFAIQALAAEYLVKHHGDMESKVYEVPREIDNEVAMIKLRSLGIKLDNLSSEQLEYMNSWKEGT
ncbi:MAG: adenosylhomocysteinase [Candidatus Thermoplasmatota archaeon]|nr:adenosylhomocysteinase [Candidatus Thermoplasmatota archaeon]